MAGTGNLLLKRGGLLPNEGVLIHGMPAVQLQGLSTTINLAGTSNGGEYAYNNYQNRLWVGVNGYGCSGTGTGSTGSTGGTAEFGTNPYPATGVASACPNTGGTRPIWMGAEIRAHTPVKENEGDTYYTILKADWNNPSDYVLVTQKAIKEYVSTVAGSSAPVLYEIDGGTTNTVTLGLSTFAANDDTGAAFSNGKILLPDPNYDIQGNTAAAGYLLAVDNVTSIYQSGTVVHLKWQPTTGFVTKSGIGLTNDSNVALLGSDGATKGTQTFQSPVGVENYLDLLGYTDINNPNNPATIKSSNSTAASIFDTGVLDISIGGATELIEIGDGSTNGNTATTIYGELTVTGPTNLSSDTVIDGGTF
jgi:hypothetical protein